MFEKDNQIISYALNMWANYIETGDVTISASDAIHFKQNEKVQSLTIDQQKFCIRLRDLAMEQLIKNRTK